MGIIIRQSIKGTVINYFGALLGFLTTFFVQTRFLSTGEIGLLGVVYEAAMLVASLAMLGTNSSAVRFFPFFKDPEKKHNGFFFYLMIFPLMGCLFFLPLYLILHTPIANYFSTNSELFIRYYYWVIPLILFLTYWFVFESYAALLLRIAVPKFIREVVLRVFLLVLYLAYGAGWLSLNGLVISYIFIYGGMALFCFLYISRIGSVSLKADLSYPSPDLRKDVLKYTGFLVLGAVGGNLVGRLDLFMVGAQMGLDYAGIYRIAFYMAAIIGIPAQSISMIASPIASGLMAKEDQDGMNDLYQKVALHQFVGGSLVFLLIWININSIFNIIPNGEVYQLGKWVVFFMGISKVIDVTLQFGSHLISFSRFYYWRLYFTFFLTAVTIITNSLLIPVLGIVGAALAMTITTIITNGTQQWIIFRKLKANPYTVGMVKQCIVLGCIWSINYLLPEVQNPWIDCLYRTAILSIPSIGLLYLFRISPEINQIINKVCRIR